MITTIAPTTWQDLEQQVALVLSQCGFTVEIEKSLTLARGNVAVDVYAEETVRGRRLQPP